MGMPVQSWPIGCVDVSSLSFTWGCRVLIGPVNLPVGLLLQQQNGLVPNLGNLHYSFYIMVKKSLSLNCKRHVFTSSSVG